MQSFYIFKILALWVNKTYLLGKLALLHIIVFILGPKNLLSHDSDFTVKFCFFF